MRPFYLRGDAPRDQTKLRALKLAGPDACEACGWAPPAALAIPGGAPAVDLLHAHHVMPVCCGGPDAAWNLALLCPTCHAVAHRVSLYRTDATKRRVYVGPKHRDDLLARLALLTTDPSAFAAALQADAQALAGIVAATAARVARRRARARNAAKRARPQEGV